MALVQFSGALVPQLGEKPRQLPASPVVARAAYFAADARFLAPKNGYVVCVCAIGILFHWLRVISVSSFTVEPVVCFAHFCHCSSFFSTLHSCYRILVT
jgi:hypothetical protein